ncbi:MAG TPA: hypothetical protein VGB83_05040 [Actinomycetota bacterium]
MKKLLLSAIAVALVASAAPVVQAGPLVGAWACPLPIDSPIGKHPILPIKPKKATVKDAHCAATIPDFPIAQPGGDVGLVQGKIYFYGADLMGPTAPVIKKYNLGNGGLHYDEITCLQGNASGTLLLDDKTGADPYEFSYIRVGPVAVVTAVGDAGTVVGVVAFLPKELDPTAAEFDPVKFLERCEGIGTSDDLKINFYGGGVVVPA